MLSHQQVDNFLLVVVLHVLLVEPAQRFQPVVHNPFEVSAACPGHVCVGRPSACVVFGDVVSVIGPGILEIDDEVVGLLGVGGLHD